MKVNRWPALFLVLLLIFFCGCHKNNATPSEAGGVNSASGTSGAAGMSDDESVRVLKWIIPDGLPFPNASYLNQVLKEKGIHSKIEFVAKSEDHYAQDVAGAKGRGEEADILFSSFHRIGNYTDPYRDFVKNNLFLVLDGYLKDDLGQKLVSQYNAKAWETFVVDGSVYGVGTNYEIPWQRVSAYDTALAQKYGITPEQVNAPLWTWESWLPKMAQGESGTPNFTPVGIPTYELLLRHYSCFESISGLFVDEEAATPSVVNIFETKEGIRLWNTLRDYQSKGYILTPARADQLAQQGKEAATFLEVVQITSDSSFKERYSNNFSFVPFGNNYVTNNTNAIGVASWSRHPKEAFEVLASILTDPELSNAAIWGQEGENYSVVEGHAVQAGTTDQYVNPKVDFGNNWLAYPPLGEPVNKAADYN